MPIVAEEVAVEVRPQPVDQRSDAGTVEPGDQLRESVNVASRSIGRADDLTMFEIGDEEHLAHQKLGEASPQARVLDAG